MPKDIGSTGTCRVAGAGSARALTTKGNEVEITVGGGMLEVHYKKPTKKSLAFGPLRVYHILMEFEGNEVRCTLTRSCVDEAANSCPLDRLFFQVRKIRQLDLKYQETSSHNGFGRTVAERSDDSVNFRSQSSLFDHDRPRYRDRNISRLSPTQRGAKPVRKSWDSPPPDTQSIANLTPGFRNLFKRVVSISSSAPLMPESRF